jgi:hypothetical protein
MCLVFALAEASIFANNHAMQKRAAVASSASQKNA